MYVYTIFRYSVCTSTLGIYGRACACKTRTQILSHTQTSAHAHTHTRAYTRARAHAHTHTHTERERERERERENAFLCNYARISRFMFRLVNLYDFAFVHVQAQCTPSQSLKHCYIHCMRMDTWAFSLEVFAHLKATKYSQDLSMASFPRTEPYI